MIANARALILAGGSARRMGGRQKALLTHEGQTLLERQQNVLTPLFARIAISSSDPFPGMEILPDRIGSGPLSGIEAGLAWAGSDHLFVVACDLPFIDTPTIERLAARRLHADIVVPRAQQIQPLLGFYAPRCRPVIEKRLRASAFRVLDLLEEPELTVEIIDLDPIHARVLHNWNSPEDI
jgi:molybdopterin-guanine dinucleotide biosynthesis protein A